MKLLDIDLKIVPLLESSSPPRCPKLVTGLKVQQTFSFPFYLLRHYQMPECFYTTAVFELVQQFYHATEIADVVNAFSACADQP